VPDVPIKFSPLKGAMARRLTVRALT